MTDQNNDDQAAKIAAIKARLAKGSSGEPAAKQEAPAASGAPAASAAPDYVIVPSGDKDALIAAIKARNAGGPRAVIEGNDPGTPPASSAQPAGAAAGAAADAGGGDDMQARIAALKAKMDAGKGESAGATTTVAAPAKAKAKSGTAKGGGKQIWPVEPITKRSFGDERMYGPATLTRWFSLASILLVIGALGMWMRDHDRGWKTWQETKAQRDVQLLDADIEAAQAALEGTNVAELQDELRGVEAQLAENSSMGDELRAAVEQADAEHYKAKSAFQSNKSLFDTEKYKFEHFRVEHGDDADGLAESTEALEAMKEQNGKLFSQWEEKIDALEEAKRAYDTHVEEQTRLTKSIEGLTGDLTLLKGRRAAIGPSLFNTLRNAPLVDALAKTLKIEQHVLADLHDDYNFMEVDRIDRCTTCHVGIDNPAYANHDVTAIDGMIGAYVPEDERPEEIGEDLEPLDPRGEVVLNAHPRLDLYVSDSSPHPARTFGCTTCHWGRGQAVEFERTFHMPSPEFDLAGNMIESKEEKTERWVRDFNYEPDRHYWAWPMVPKDMVYSACFQCHDSTDRIAGVPEYNEPRELVEDLGCYACHKIDGFEHLRKPGPDLTNLAVKTDEEWVQKWLISPKDFRETTRMPHFWNLSNSGGSSEEAYDGQTELAIDAGMEWDNNKDKYVGDWRARNQVEARAVAKYLMSQSTDAMESGVSSYSNDAVPEGGDADRGRELVSQRGCLGCHSIESEEWLANDHGPDLSAVGSKVEPDWMYSWIMNPERYFESTVMPSLRLTPEEGADITSYMMTLRDEEWEEVPTPTENVDVLREVAADFKSGATSVSQASAWANAADVDELELFVGEKVFDRFGCSGCHLVPGHYDDMGIGVELTKEALKELSKFDFSFESHHGSHPPEGHAHVEHTVWGWINAKLEDTRRFDRVPVIEEGESGDVVARYEQKVKRPLDKLRMPYYYLTDKERHQVTTFVMGLREVGVSDSMKHNLTPDEELFEEGNRLITEYNCTGCHKMGQFPLPATLDEDLLDLTYDENFWIAHDLAPFGVQIFAAGDWVSDEFYNSDEGEDYDTLEHMEDDNGVSSLPIMVHGLQEGPIAQYYDDGAFAPPVLRRQGEKTQPDWLHSFLIDPFIVRPHLEVRMPTFGFTDEESRALVHWFAFKDKSDWPFYKKPDVHQVLNPEMYAQGRDLFANEFGCAQCHPAGDQLPTNADKANWGPDLSLARDRLQAPWIHDWLVEPSEFQPGTKMPSFFGDIVDGELDATYDDTEERIKAIEHYLIHLQPTEE